jgi:hypothetical protein
MFGFGAQHFGPIAKLMGVRFPSVFSTTVLNSPIVTTAETVVVTTPGLVPPLDGATVFLLWMTQVTVGASSTGMVMTLRRGVAVASPAVQQFNTIPMTAGAGGLGCGIFVDTPGSVTGVQYSLTLSMTAATGNTTVNQAALLAFAL